MNLDELLPDRMLYHGEETFDPKRVAHTQGNCFSGTDFYLCFYLDLLEEILIVFPFYPASVLCDFLNLIDFYLYHSPWFVGEIANETDFVLGFDLCLGGEILMLPPFDLSLIPHDFLNPIDFYLYLALCYFFEEEIATEIHFVLDIYLGLDEEILTVFPFDLYLGLCYWL